MRWDQGHSLGKPRGKLVATEGARPHRRRPGQAGRAGDSWKTIQVGWVKEVQVGGSKQRSQQYKKLTLRAGLETWAGLGQFQGRDGETGQVGDILAVVSAEQTEEPQYLSLTVLCAWVYDFV